MTDTPNILDIDRAAAAIQAVSIASGRWLGPWGTSSTGSPSLNRLIYVPVFVPRRQAFDRIGVNVSGGTATAVCRLGIYLPTTSGLPGTLLQDAGTVDCSAAAEKTITIAQTLNPGLWYLASVMQVATTGMFVSGQQYMPGGWDSPALNAGSHQGYYEDSVSGALPATATPVGAAQTSGAAVRLRAV